MAAEHIPPIKKPDNWTNTPLYKKIFFYRGFLGPIHAEYTDKLKAKEIVKSICGSRIKIAEVVRMLSGPSDLQKEDIQNNHFIKATHGSGWLIDCAQETNLKENKAWLKRWNCIYSKEERQYTFLQPRFFIEKKIHCAYLGGGGKALDIKVNCFYGKVVFLSIQTPDKKRNYYLPDGTEVLPPEFPYKRPNEMDELLELASALSKPFEYVRMDFYIAVDGIYFSEFTFTPKNGERRIPEELELEFGKMWL